MKRTLKYLSPVANLTSQHYQLVSRFLPSKYCSNKMSISLFEDKDHAKLYAKFRPTYPDDVFKVIGKYCKHYNGYRFQLAVDVGCGNGQSTLPLIKEFKKVIGIDVSESQIQQAKKTSTEAEFRVGPAEELGFLKTGSVDLITTAQAFHWIDHEKYFTEVTRVLKPGGVLAVYGYGNCKIDIDDAQKVVWKFYRETLKGYWDKQRENIDIEYRNYSLPYDGWERNETLFIRKTWSVDNFVGYVSSWSGWQSYLKQNSDSKELQIVRDKLKSLYTTDEGERAATVTWPIFMLLGRKPG